MIEESESKDAAANLIFLSLAFYWGAALSIRFGLYSGGAFLVKAPEYNLVGSIGLLLVLLVAGAFPKLLDSRMLRRMLHVLPFFAGFAIVACAALCESGFYISSGTWLAVRFLLAASVGCVLIQAGPSLVSMPKKKAALAVAASFGFGVLMSTGTSSLPMLPNALVSALFIWVAAGSASRIPRVASESDIDPDQESSPPPEKRVRILEWLGSMPSGFWAFFFGLTFYSIVYGITLTLFPLMELDENFVLPVNPLLLISGAAMFLLLSGKPNINLKLFQWFLFVPVAIGFFPLPIVNAAGGVICCSLLIVTFTFYDVTSIVILSEMARGVPRIISIRVFAWGRAANILGMGIGTLLVVPFVQDGTAVDQSKLIVLVFVAVSVMVAGMAYLGKSAFSTTNLHRDDSAGKWKRACEATGREFELSPRELEVLEYLAKGRSADYIANKLYIAPSTVKTHTYRIYQKIEVHSQQDLMDIIEKQVSSENSTQETR